MYQKKTNDTNLVTYNKLGQITDYEEVQEIIKVQKRHFKKGEFFLMKNDFLYSLVLKSDYKFLEIKVITYMLKHLDFNNRIETFRQADLAEEIGSTQPRISKVLNKLRKDKIIYKIGADYYFNDQYVKGAGNEKQKKKLKNDEGVDN